jgi:hypothetical protein
VFPPGDRLAFIEWDGKDDGNSELRLHQLPGLSLIARIPLPPEGSPGADGSGSERHPAPAHQQPGGSGEADREPESLEMRPRWLRAAIAWPRPGFPANGAATRPT